MRRFLLTLALTLATTLSVTAQEKPPAWQSIVYTNDLSAAIRAALEPDERGQTNSIQAVLNAISDLIGDGTAIGISVDTNGWLVLKPDTNNVQSTFDFIDDWLNVTNAGAYLDPGLTNNVSLQAIIDAINEALAPESLTASQIGISTNGTLGDLGFTSTNTVQDVLDAMGTGYVTQVQLRQFISAGTNRSIKSDTWTQEASFSAGPHAADAFVTLLPTNVTSNLFIQVSSGQFQPRNPGLVYIIDMALVGSTASYAIGDDTVTFGVRTSNVVSGAVTLWTDQQLWNRAKTMRSNLAITTGIGTNDRVSFILNTTTSMTVGAWGAYPKAGFTSNAQTP